MSFGKRLKDARLACGNKQGVIADYLGITQTALSDYERDKRNPPRDTIVKLADRYKVNLNWLLTGEGEMYQQLIEINPAFLDDMITLPIVAEIAAGEPVEALLDEPLGHMSIPKRLLHFPPPYFVFSVKGRSMEPMVMNRDIVVCSQSWAGVNIDGKIMAFRTHEGITLKKIQFDRKTKTTWIMPINHEYTPRIYDSVDDEEIVMIGILDIAIRGYNRS